MSYRNLARRSFSVRWLAAAAVLTLAAGCGSSTDVTGKVTYKGAPLTAGSVTLVASDGIVYSGTLGADGTFSIPGVPTGEAKVGVVGANPAAGTKPPPASRGPRGGPGAAGRGGPPPGEGAAAPAPPPTGPVLPREYGDPRTSGLTVQVRAGEPVNIDLK